MPANKNMDNANRTAPGAKLFDSRDGKKNPKIVGVSRRLWAMSDTTPVAIRRTFLNENRDMLCKRIAQKGHFFYRRYTHDQPIYFKLLSALKVIN
jgi:hypothetical protein